MLRLSCQDKTERQVYPIRYYAEKYGVTKAARRYHTNRQYVYRWRARYDGTLGSLEDRSHRPHSHPKQHQPEEIKFIDDMRRRNPNAGLTVFWVKLRQRGYKRSISGLYRFLKKRGQMAVRLPSPKYIPKPYKKADYPGQADRCKCTSPGPHKGLNSLSVNTHSNDAPKARCTSSESLPEIVLPVATSIA